MFVLIFFSVFSICLAHGEFTLLPKNMIPTLFSLIIFKIRMIRFEYSQEYSLVQMRQSSDRILWENHKMLNKCGKFYRKFSPHTSIDFPKNLLWSENSR